MSKSIKIALSFLPQDLQIIDAHNQELACPGRSAALRHILREWSAMKGGVVTVPVVGKNVDGQVVENHKE